MGYLIAAALLGGCVYAQMRDDAIRAHRKPPSPVWALVALALGAAIFGR